MKNKVICPLAVYVTKRKKFILNLNNYRNTHYRALVKAKKEYLKIVTPQVRGLIGWKKVEVVFTMFPRDNRTIDTANVCSIHEKFLMDAIVTLGKLPDDDYKHHIKTTYLFGKVDRNNPMVEALFVGRE